MHGFKGERTLMRIHIGERDRDPSGHKPLYQAIVELLRANRFAGCTVFRGMMGFGATARVKTDRVEVLSLDLPVVVEAVETEARIEAVLPALDGMIGGGLITLERAKVIMYRPELRDQDKSPSDAIDVTGSWESPPPGGTA